MVATGATSGPRAEHRNPTSLTAARRALGQVADERDIVVMACVPVGRRCAIRSPCFSSVVRGTARRGIWDQFRLSVSSHGSFYTDIVGSPGPRLVSCGPPLAGHVGQLKESS